MEEITGLGAAELGRLIYLGELTSTEVVEAHLARARQFNPGINAITDLQADQALELAAEADKEWLRRRPAAPLHGVPLTIKSSIAAKGFRYECGSPLRRGEVADSDATLVARLKAAGAIVIGSTNVPEFLMAYETDNAVYGRTNSPLDAELTPGGSSGGCSAAVAAGCSAGSFGSDGGGSVRVPAHFCGLYGMKPTPGAIPRTGHWPGVAGPATILAGVGPITRTAEDLNLFLSVTAGSDPGDISSPPSQPRELPEGELAREVKVGWFDHAWNTPATTETCAAVHDAAHALRERGFDVERTALRGLESAPQVWWQQFGICLRTLIESSVPGGYRLHPLAYDAMASRDEESATGYRDLLTGWVQQDHLRLKLQDQMRDRQVLLCPVAAVPAFRHGQRSWSVQGEEVGYPGAFVYSQVFNLLGVPAASVPVGSSATGLPIGVQVVGRPWDDFLVTAVAQELESAFSNA